MNFFKNMSGEKYIFLELIFWSMFPIFSILTFSSIHPLYSAAFSTFLASVFFAIVITIKKKWNELLKKDIWKELIIATIIIGIFFYSMTFIGLNMSTAGNMGIIFLMEVFFGFFFLGFLGKEKITLNGTIGAIIMVIGALIIFLPDVSKFGLGDLLLLIAISVTPLGNFYQKKIMKKISSSTLMFVRSFISSIFIFLFALFFSKPPTYSQILSSLFFLIPNGILFMGFSKVLWLEGIHRIPITKAISIGTITPMFTLFFSFLILGEIPSLWQIIGLFPMILGAHLVLKTSKQNKGDVVE
ncbi:DMT family transporter [archaeon]|jgi:drug/metabolite transporter (DMT)-like permease|nr:DMT family transporter [archaeon]MBT4351146.1 DMT family transporter [archaeon]MBT4648271.1 DMT family transporter [archaeon]MBT6821523.1 DMT family transporter [archaeon]MBT7391922.1 DMT family transporter [archaeon]